MERTSLLDVDFALLEAKLADLTEASTVEEKLYHKAWTRSNRLSLMFMRMTIANNIKTAIDSTESAKKYLELVEARFRSLDKSLAGTLMSELTTMKFTETVSMQAHIIEITNITARLKTLGMAVDDSFLV